MENLKPMKKFYSIFVLPLSCLLFFSCSVDAMQEKLDVEGEYGYDFRESRKAWKNLKKQNGDSYVYTILEQSWTGHGSETVLRVEKGKVTSRYYVAFTISDEDGARTITNSYEETSKKGIGSHSLGAPPLTIDNLYSTCISQYLTVDHEANEVLFETNEEGVMMLCGFVPIGCHDDCYRGIRISEFYWE